MVSVDQVVNWATRVLPLLTNLTLPFPSFPFTSPPSVPSPFSTSSPLTKPVYTPLVPPLTTPWTPTASSADADADLDPHATFDVWTTHPRPQLKRDWKSLNGVWTYRNATEKEAAWVSTLAQGGREGKEGKEGKGGKMGKEERVPTGWLEKGVLIPSCLESGISGIMNNPGTSEYSWFQTTFDVPESWGDKVLLNFGAVDYEATVFVNGYKAGWHRGGYARFSVDITSYLRQPNLTYTNPEERTEPEDDTEKIKDAEIGINELVVFVHDPTDSGDYNIPVGKQTNRPSHIFYTPCSGIWQPVYIEPAPEVYVTRLDVTAGMDGVVNITAHSSDGQGAPVEVTVTSPSGSTTTGHGHADTAFTFAVPNPDLWSPSSPVLYDLTVRLDPTSSALSGATDGVSLGPGTADIVHSYTAFRTISRLSLNGIHTVALNDDPIFPFGTLDQGYWPDGLYTPPSPAAMEYDLTMAKDLGFNMVRKHIKVEMDTWFEACDRLGLLVVQDMPSMRALQTWKDEKGDDHLWMPTIPQQGEFVRQLMEMIELHKSFPSIFTWVIYNEGWGQLPSHPEVELVDLVRSLDPTRLVDATSGWHDGGVGDFSDNHHYANPQCGAPVYSYESGPFDSSRIGFQGEFGGLAHNVSVEHLWNVPHAVNGINQTYEVDGDLESWNYRAHTVLTELLHQTTRYACGGAVYTQTTDVEGELNGLVTYDRRVFRPDVQQWKRDIQALYDATALRAKAASEL